MNPKPETCFFNDCYNLKIVHVKDVEQLKKCYVFHNDRKIIFFKYKLILKCLKRYFLKLTLIFLNVSFKYYSVHFQFWLSHICWANQIVLIFISRNSLQFNIMIYLSSKVTFYGHKLHKFKFLANTYQFCVKNITGKWQRGQK